MFEVISIVGVVLFVLFVIVSIWMNIFLTRKLLYFTENVNNVNGSIDIFVDHLDGLYEMPLFYGDENMQELISHSKQLRTELKEFRETYKE
jgi:hypothetical protein|tara:strand:+ start:2206 stop:2478 length:273 start_codon:yes stop_codon:yes gene_type:complete